MSKLSDLKAHIHSLGEINSILNAMKNLSVVEMTKISHLLATQGKVAGSIQEALVDFESFYGAMRVNPGTEGQLFVLVGSERGFCGGFNEQIHGYFNESALGQKDARILIVGRKLALKFEGDPRVIGTMDGSSATEEIPAVISNLSERLMAFSSLRWVIVHHDGEESRLGPMETCPLENTPGGSPPEFPFPALLNLPPAELYPLLLEQHLYATLYRVFYLSFMAENRERLRHMEGALGKIEKKMSRMSMRANALRQETITEELEVIMLNVKETKLN